MTIKLGIFTKLYSAEYSSLPGLMFSEFVQHYKLFHIAHNVESCVKYVAEKADKINFVLDGIQIPINSCKSLTCLELAIILENPKFLKKTQFYHKRKKVDRIKTSTFIQKIANSDSIFSF